MPLDRRGLFAEDASRLICENAVRHPATRWRLRSRHRL